MLTTDKNKKVIETNGQLNEVIAMLAALGLTCEVRRGTSTRSERCTGYYDVNDKDGNTWHVVG